MEYRSDGLTESIINSLTQLPNLRVIARSSVFPYKGREADPREVGRELSVRTILTGGSCSAVRPSPSARSW